MIASPSDVQEARDAVEQAIHGWNDANSRHKGVILLPWRWETSAVPVLGDHPQRLINAQGVNDSDIVFAMFAGRLGSATPDAISGTAEEIDRALNLGKPVHLYFSTEPLPADIDTKQLEALRSFKTAMQDQGLLGEYSNTSQLGHEVWKAIEHDIAGLSLPEPNAPADTGVTFLVQPQREREMTGVDNRGKPKYTTRHWIDITNTGSVDAEDVTFKSIGENTTMHLGNSGEPTVIHAGQTRRLVTLYMMGGGPRILRISWRSGDNANSKDFHVG